MYDTWYTPIGNIYYSKRSNLILTYQDFSDQN